MNYHSVFGGLVKIRPGCQFYTTGTDWVWEDDEDSKPTQEEVEAAAAEWEAEQPMIELRQQRDKLMAETDWWASSDRTMTAEQIAYRQALRDLPANTADPANPVWPTKP